LYEARRNKSPIHPDTISNVQQRLAIINGKIPFVHLLQTTWCLSRGLCLFLFVLTQHDVDQCSFPPFPFVTLDWTVISPEITIKLNSQQKSILDEVTIASETVDVIEAQTREQKQCEECANVRKFQLNSSTRRQILHRRKITKKFSVTCSWGSFAMR
jgi:hypothetical protein